MCTPFWVLGKSTNASKVGSRIIGLLSSRFIFNSFFTPVTPTLVSDMGVSGVLSCVSGNSHMLILLLLWNFFIILVFYSFIVFCCSLFYSCYIFVSGNTNNLDVKIY